MTNPLLSYENLPPFSQIKPEHILPALEKVVEEYRQVVEQISVIENPIWENFFMPLTWVSDKLHKVWSPVSHLNSVQNSEELREAYHSCLPLLAEHSTWVGQHQGLYQGFLKLKNSADFDNFSPAQKKAIEKNLREFELSGIALPKEQQQRFGEIAERLSELSANFSNNVLDATMDWELVEEDLNNLKGLPETALEAAKLSAEQKGVEGYRFTLEGPSFSSFMSYCENADLRAKMYKEYTTRASDEGANAGKFDNSEIMSEILKLRKEKAELLGFKNYAQRSLVTKMAESPEKVVEFLEDLVNKAQNQAKEEYASLKKFVKENYQVEELNAWDVSFYSEKQKKSLFNISEEELRAYFPKEKALQGLFEVLNRLFKVTVKERTGVDVWHSDVQFFDIFDAKNNLKGSFYLDLYARENKIGGAWMDGAITRGIKQDGSIQNPVAYLTCNFNKPTKGKPALFTHYEVLTLFHEFGHGIHHMLTAIDVPEVSGINGVPWDTVELPSQFLENWCWEEEALNFISGHFETGEPLSKEILTKLKQAQNFQSALMLLRQLEHSLFDMKLHLSEPNETSVMEVLQEVKKAVAVIQTPAWVRTPHSFGHIFSGGYAAGYYSYLWAEVLSADAFSRFIEEGIFSEKAGQSFLENILEKGGSVDALELFAKFRGREPQIEPLLKSRGIL